MNKVWMTPSGLPSWVLGMINPAISTTGVVSVQGWGLLTAPTASVASSTYNIVSEDGLNYQGNTSAVSGNEAFVRSGTKPIVLDGFASFAAKFQIGQIGNARMFIGISDQLSGYTTSADPAGKRIGLWYDSALPSPSWRFVSDNGTTQTLVDTLLNEVNPSFDDPMYLTIDTIDVVTLTVKLVLWNRSYSVDLPIAQTVFTTELPASNTLMFGVIALTTTSAVSRNFRLYGMQAAINGRPV